MDKKLIEIFRLSESLDDQATLGGGCCSGGCCCGSAKSLTTDELVDRFTEKYNSFGEFKVHELTDENKEAFFSRLNTVLIDSGERLVIDESNFDFVRSKVFPLIAVDGKVISVKNNPDEEQLYEAIMTGKKIPIKTGCC